MSIHKFHKIALYFPWIYLNCFRIWSSPSNNARILCVILTDSFECGRKCNRFLVQKPLFCQHGKQFYNRRWSLYARTFPLPDLAWLNDKMKQNAYHTHTHTYTRSCTAHAHIQRASEHCSQVLCVNSHLICRWIQFIARYSFVCVYLSIFFPLSWTVFFSIKL